MISDILGTPLIVKKKKKSNKTRFEWRMGMRKLRKIFSKETVIRWEEEGKALMSLLAFFGLLLFFLLDMLVQILKRVKLLGKVVESSEKWWSSKLGKQTEKLIMLLENKQGSIRRSFLIALAFRNMRVKRSRSLITVGGMSLGIATIVFLVSLGYGLQRLVVNRVASLTELKMADVTVSQGGKAKLDGEALQTLKHIPKVTKIIPMVSLVGKVKFGGGVGEAVVYGVSGDYLKLSGLNKVKGDFFTTKELASNKPDEGRVAGLSTEWNWQQAEYKQRIRNVVFNIEPEIYLRVRSEPSLKGKVLGYVKRVEGGFSGVEYWGGQYRGDNRGREGKSANGRVLGRWIKAPYPLWRLEHGKYEPVFDSERVQEWQEGYVAEVGAQINEDESSYVVWDDVTDRDKAEVLGEATASGNATIKESKPKNDESDEATISAKVVGVDSQGVEWVELDGNSQQDQAKKNKTLVLKFDKNVSKEAVVNESFVKLLGLKVNKAVGTSFEISLVVLSSLKPELKQPARSETIKYKIKAVVNDGSSPLVYIPLKDVVGLGVNRYSQVKVMVAKKGDLPKVREQVENLGYKTASVADTVANINKLFATVKLVLGVFGLVALVVASLGMFNTLTVSLMERTREVGVMKAMGMQSKEVNDLFMAEAIVMGILGGVFGVIGGWLAGKLVGLVLSLFALSKGVGFIDVSYVSPWFVVFVITLSFLVGILTGIYPAKRATKISALDALRYE